MLNSDVACRFRRLELQPRFSADNPPPEMNAAGGPAENLRHLETFAGVWAGRLISLGIDLSARDSAAKQLLAVFLPAGVEDEVAQVWRESPSRALGLHCLCAWLCRAAVELALPGVSGCLPLPALSLAEKHCLNKILSPWGLGLGQAAPEAGGFYLGRNYALLTYLPYRGGCPVCALKTACRKTTDS